MKLFLQKHAKFSSAGGSAPRPPLASAPTPPTPPQTAPPPNCEFLATRLDAALLVGTHEQINRDN